MTQRKKQPEISPGLLYRRLFAGSETADEIQKWLHTIHPIWEERYSKNNPPPPGQEQRTLLRPTYWLGNWQFACLNYFHPPKWVENCCVEAEPFPRVLRDLVCAIEATSHKELPKEFFPKGWMLNTCLVNFYGSKLVGERRMDCARVGEHKDFEPGPVASFSIGERALFQFVSSKKIGERDSVVHQQWLDHLSLQLISGPKWKDQLFHRVQRVDRQEEFYFPIHTENFKVRRINLTFRYVPPQYIVPFGKLPQPKREDVSRYITRLAEHSEFFRKQL